jgi:hypothetical protein
MVVGPLASPGSTTGSQLSRRSRSQCFQEIKRRTKTGCLTCRKRRIKVRGFHSFSPCSIDGGALEWQTRCGRDDEDGEIKGTSPSGAGGFLAKDRLMSLDIA